MEKEDLLPVVVVVFISLQSSSNALDVVLYFTTHWKKFHFLFLNIYLFT